MKLVLLVLIDEVFVAFSILASAGLAVVGDFSSNLFPSVKFVVFAVGFGLCRVHSFQGKPRETCVSFSSTSVLLQHFLAHNLVVML